MKEEVEAYAKRSKKYMKDDMDNMVDAKYYKMDKDKRNKYDDFEKKWKKGRGEDDNEWDYDMKDWKNNAKFKDMNKSDKMKWMKKQMEGRGKETDGRDKFRKDQFKDRMKKGYFDKESGERDRMDDDYKKGWKKKAKGLKEDVEEWFGMDGGSMCGDVECEDDLCCGVAKLVGGDTSRTKKECQQGDTTQFTK